jgi:hypothetical protein
MSRREIFNEAGAENIYEYEKKTGKKMARVLTVMEEFHAIPYVILNFTADFKTELTHANKYHTLMRIGRSYGLWFIACSQRSTKSDIPPEVAPNFIQKMVFRVSRGEAQYLLGDSKAADIRPDQKGRCMTDYGPVQFPLMNESTQRRLLKKYAKKLTAPCAYLNYEIIKDYLSGKSTKEQYKYKKLMDLVNGIESYNGELVVSLLHEKQGHRVEPIDSKLDSFGISHIVHWNNDIKVAVMTRCNAKSKKITGKHISRIKKAMHVYECTHGIIYTSMDGLPASLYKIANELDIEVVDHEDMKKLAYKVDLAGEDSKLTPDHLADDSKESGEYQITHPGADEDEGYSTTDFNPAEFNAELADSEIIDLQAAEEEHQEEKAEETVSKIKKINRLLGEDEPSENNDFEKDFEENSSFEEEGSDNILEDFSKEEKKLDVQNPKVEPQVSPATPTTSTLPGPGKNKEFLLTVNQPNRATKRIKVNKLVTIKKDDNPSLLFHAMKNESGEIYRVMFYILDSMVVKHRYFIDRQVSKPFSFKEKQWLGVASVEEWNAQKEVLNPIEFDKDFLEFLENFSPCSFPAHSVCWKEDEDFFKRYLVQCKFMINHSTIIETHTEVFYNVIESRDNLIIKMGVKVSPVDMFTPIEIDYRIWRDTN